MADPQLFIEAEAKGRRLIVLITPGKKYSLVSLKPPFSDHFCLVFYMPSIFHVKQHRFC